MMDSSPGLVRRRIQEMSTSFQSQHSPRNSPKNSPKNQSRRKIHSSLQPSLANVEPNKMTSVPLPNTNFNAGARPFKKLYTATATATITTNKSPTVNRRTYNPMSTNNSKNSCSNQKQKLNTEPKNKRVFPPSENKTNSDCKDEKMKSKIDENIKSAESSYHTNGIKQRRKTTPTSVLLTAPKPFKSLTNTYGSHTKPNKNTCDLEMDCTDGRSSLVGKATNSFSSLTLPSAGRHQKTGENGVAANRDKIPSSQNYQESPPLSPEPPPILPRRSTSALKSPVKPAVPPKPKNINKSTPSPTKPSHSLKNRSCSSLKYPSSGSPPLAKESKNEKLRIAGADVEKDVEADAFCESPLKTSFTMFNQRVSKLDLLKRRQSYSEFEELIEKKRELRERMMTKILRIRKDRDLLLAEKKDNDNIGSGIMARLEQMATTTEVDKYRQFLEEIEQITKLTVGLTIRLSRLTKRIENGGSQLNEEMLSLEKKKRKRLVEQTHEAEFLHRNTDRRSTQVRKMLSRYLDESDLNDYDAFLNNLIKHITDLKETEQRIQLGEEQLVALNDNLQNNTTPSPPPTSIP